MPTHSILHVVYSGEGLFKEDIQCIESEIPIHIEVVPALGRLESPHLFAEKFKRCDLAIFKVNGAFEFIRYMQTYGHIPLVQGIFHASKMKKVLWSVDTHVMQNLESHLTHLDYFDKIYSAHSSFMKEFDSSRTSWLPCCYRISSMKKLAEFNRIPPTTDREVLFYYNPTPTGDRDELALKAKSICDKMGLRSLFGHVGAWDVFPHFIKSSKVCINLSMKSELNYRFFELQALNAIQIGDRASDLEKIEFEKGNIHFICRNLSNFEAALNKALAQDTVMDSQKVILKSHMLIHRLLAMIRDMLGVSVKLAGIQ